MSPKEATGKGSNNACISMHENKKKYLLFIKVEEEEVEVEKEKS